MTDGATNSDIYMDEDYFLKSPCCPKCKPSLSRVATESTNNDILEHPSSKSALKSNFSPSIMADNPQDPTGNQHIVNHTPIRQIRSPSRKSDSSPGPILQQNLSMNFS
jgi:hypothetical protein